MMTGFYIGGLIIWGLIGMIVGSCNLDNWDRMKISKKQTVFLFIVLGPLAWAIGIICLIVLAFKLTWKLLS